jgi:UDP-GlcNAc:undecaprenyl-phosphate/decaprenyl-phosphate GlcNAc-1-phosphate transferase
LDINIIALLSSFFIALLFTPSLIKLAMQQSLDGGLEDSDVMDSQQIPAIGGIIIFAGTILSYALWYKGSPENLQYVVAGGMLLLFIGIKDNISGIAPVKKLLVQIAVGLIIVLMADVRITSLHGLFGIREIPHWGSVFLSLYAYLVIVNSFNLMDDIDGLASSVGILASFAFFFWFFIAGDTQMALLAITLGGSLMAFLFYNFSPAKILMGESGFLTIGFVFTFLAIRMIEFKTHGLPSELINVSRPILALSILSYPLTNTLRLFIYRLVKGASPFSADKNHLHHRLLKIGLSHNQTVAAIVLCNFLLILFTFILQGTSTTLYFFLMTGFAIALAQIPFFFHKLKNKGLNIEKEIRHEY